MSLEKIVQEMLVQSKTTSKEFLKEVRKLLDDEDIMPQRYERVSWRDDNEDTVTALNPVTSIMNFMNPTLGVIFKLCNGNNTQRDIEEKMSQLFPIIDRKIIRADFKNAMIQLFSSGYINLVKRSDGESEVLYVTDILSKREKTR